MMRLIDRLVFKDMIGPFLSGLGMFLLLVFTAGYLFQATEWLLMGVGVGVVLQMVLLSLPDVITQTFPMAMLLAGLLSFGRLSADREIIAVFASGISFPRAVRVVIIMGLFVSVAAFVWNETVVPPAKEAFWQIRKRSVDNMQSSAKPLSYSIPRRDGDGIEEFVTIDGGYDSKSKTVRRVALVKYSSLPLFRGQVEAMVYCDRAQVHDEKGLNWTYYDGYFVLYTPDRDTGQVVEEYRNDFREMTTLPRQATLGKSFGELPSSGDSDSTRKSFSQLRNEINRDRERGRIFEARGKEVDLYGKIALPLASLIFGVVGAALGVSTQRGGGKTVGFGMAIFIVFIYWIFYRSMFVVGKNGGLPPMLASFCADIVGAAVGIILTMRASR